MLKVGIVGLSNAGKSTLFNALVKRSQAQTENRPFTTIEPNIGVVQVPDERLVQIAQIARPAKIVPATVEFVDIAGLVKDAYKGAGLGNQFLAHIREVDAVLILLRGFVDPIVVHTEGRVNPQEDLEILLLELSLADLAHPSAPRISEKPRLVVENVDENYLAKPSKNLRVCAKLEAELAGLPEKDQQELLGDLGVIEPPLNRVIRASYDLLGWQTFFTAGPKEVRAWTVKKGASAPQAAGAIHNDFERGFIRAEVVSFQDYIKYGGELGAKSAGKLRSEGREYVIKDGDVAHFRFNI